MKLKSYTNITQYTRRKARYKNNFHFIYRFIFILSNNIFLIFKYIIYEGQQFEKKKE